MANSLGDAFIDVHANNDPFRRELPDGIRKAANDAQNAMPAIGENLGAEMSKGMTAELGKHGDEHVDAIEGSIRRRRINIDGKWFSIDRNNNLHDTAGRFAGKFLQETQRAFDALAGGGGFGKIGEKVSEGISDAVGASFNVSGKSPLVGPLALGIMGLIGVILAAVEAANALVAVLATLPALITAIGLQAGVLMLAFEGVGGAVQKAFAATNATELQQALVGLTPAAQEFVRSLLPLRDLFNQIKAIAQESFFKAFGDSLTRVAAALGPILQGGVGQLATALGTLFAQLADFFASPTFVDFVNDIIPATVQWLGSFGPSLVNFMSALVSMSDAALPFLTFLGGLLNGAMKTFSDWLTEAIGSGDFKQWLSNMASVLQSVVELFWKLTEFVATFLDELDSAGGQDIIDQLADSFEQLVFFLKSPVGKEFMLGLVAMSIIAIQAITGLIEVVAFIIAAFTFALEAIGAFLDWLWNVAIPAIGEFFTWLGGVIMDAWNAILDFFRMIGEWILDAVDSIAEGFITGWNAVIDFLQDLPGMIWDFLSGLPSMLWNLGKSAIDGLINSMIDGMNNAGAAVGNAAKNMVSNITPFLPGSPAEKGPLSGRGYSYLRGQRMVQDLARGMAQETPMVAEASANVANNVNFGGVSLNFSGALPTEDQARALGGAAADGMSAQMSKRNIQLAVRSA